MEYKIRLQLNGKEKKHRVSGDEAFSEAAVRFFPFIAGLASVALVGLLGWTCGLPLSGAAAAFLMALSPWHLRYSVEARGYSSMILFSLIGLLALIMCLRGGRWRWWFIYGASQSAVLLCFAGAIYLIAAQNFFAVFAIIIRGKRRRWMLWRWAVASALTAIPLILLMAPSVPQILAYFGRQDVYNPDMGMGWLRDVWAHMVGGIPWADQTAVDPKSPLWGDEAGMHLGTSVMEQNSLRNWVAPMFRLVVPALTFCGIVALCLKNWKTRLLVVAFVWAGVLFYAHNAIAGNPAHGWYLIFLLPMFALALPAAAEVAIHGRNQPVVVGVMVAIVIGYGFLVGEQLQKLREHDRQPIRQTVAKINELAGSQTPLTGVFGTSDRQVKTYDPEVRILQKAEDVDLLVLEGQAKKRPVFIYYCGDVISWRKRPEVVQRIASDRRFERIAYLPGLEAMYSYRIFRYER